MTHADCAGSPLPLGAKSARPPSVLRALFQLCQGSVGGRRLQNTAPLGRGWQTGRAHCHPPGPTSRLLPGSLAPARVSGGPSPLTASAPLLSGFGRKWTALWCPQRPR